MYKQGKIRNKVIPAGELAVPCNLQSATVGVVSDPRADCVQSAPCGSVMTNGSCAINGLEPCQAGAPSSIKGYV